MKLVVVVPTYGRKAQVAGLMGDAGRNFTVSRVFGRTELGAQRNNALAEVLASFDIVTFFDDDFLPADEYLARVVEPLDRKPAFAVFVGRVVADGVHGVGYDWDIARSLLRAAPSAPGGPDIVDHVGASGCNMSIRSSLVGDLRFDERLPLYGWQRTSVSRANCAGVDVWWRCNPRSASTLSSRRRASAGCDSGTRRVANPV